ncbi:MAG: RecB-family nuclease [Candidatus Methanomethylicia archaeon]|nr:RecB-family nuclease [Candidatus Methanomethylicia archaeon]MDW7988981.1 RecB-family nuclease [Nitrososphaerota archaeon]
MKNIIMVIHNIHSPQRLIELTKVFYGLGFKNLVVSKATGAASQIGIPEVQKISIKTGGRLIITSDLNDAIDLIKPNSILLAVPKPYGKSIYNPEEVAKRIIEGLLVMIVIGGLEPGLTIKELTYGEPVYIDIEGDVGCVGLATIILYETFKHLRKISY